MSKYQIIEDCSPYYIRFTHEGIEKFCENALTIHNNRDWSSARIRLELFRRRVLAQSDAMELLKDSPISSDIDLNYSMTSYFVSFPGLRYRVHKDGMNINFSINYGLKIQDSLCYTRWYEESISDLYNLDTLGNTSRELKNVDTSIHPPLCTMVAKQYEVTLVNTSLWHEWDNSQSNNERIVLTLRVKDYDNFYYEDVRKILFS